MMRRWWLLAAGAFAMLPLAQGGAASDALEIITDRTGDSRSGGAVGFGVLDIHSLTVVAEDPEKVELHLATGPFCVSESSPDSALGSIEIDFKVRNLTHKVNLPVAQHAEPGSGSLCVKKGMQIGRVSTTFENGPSEPSIGAAHFSFDDQNDIVALQLWRYDLQGSGHGYTTQFRLARGDELHSFVVTSFLTNHDQRSTPGPMDRAPDDGHGKPYALRFDAPSTVLQVRAARQLDEIPFEPGRTQLVNLQVGNLMEAKRTINLTYEIGATSDSAKGKVFVTGPSSVTVPGGRWRNYTFTLETAAEFPETAYAYITVKAISVESGDYAYDSLRLVLGQVLEPRSKPMNLHVRKTAPYILSEEQCVTPGILLRCTTQGFLSEKTRWPGTDPGAELQINVATEVSPIGTVIWNPQLLAYPVAFGDNGHAKLSFRIRADPLELPEAQIIATLVMKEPGGQVREQASATRTLTLKSAPEALEFDLPLKPSEQRVWLEGSAIGVVITVIDPDPSHHQAYAVTSTAMISPEEFRLTLPIVELPPEWVPAIAPSPFQISYSGEREEFVNPGKAKLLNVTVTNIDSEAQRLRLVANASISGWLVEVLPGSTFEMPASESITAGILVHAPAEAFEGQHALITVHATSDDGSQRVHHIMLIATLGADFDDDTGRYLPGDDELSRLYKPPPATPGASILWILLFGLLVLARRHQDS